MPASVPKNAFQCQEGAVGNLRKSRMCLLKLNESVCLLKGVRSIFNYYSILDEKSIWQTV